jgi:threonine/homoserine/homoserine lactone efflux protein
MPLSILLAKIAGVILLAWTARSIWKHVRERRQAGTTEQSVSESILNNLLLYLWLAFMTVFSLGLIFNNNPLEF